MKPSKNKLHRKLQVRFAGHVRITSTIWFATDVKPGESAELFAGIKSLSEVRDGLAELMRADRRFNSEHGALHDLLEGADQKPDAVEQNWEAAEQNQDPAVAEKNNHLTQQSLYAIVKVLAEDEPALRRSTVGSSPRQRALVGSPDVAVPRLQPHQPQPISLDHGQVAFSPLCIIQAQRQQQTEQPLS
jgi:hypothetical protein